MKPTLLLGYGNLDRQDDGVAWHVLRRVAERLGLPAPADEDFAETGGEPHLRFVLQLTPELAETLAQFERVCFIDAHTGAVPEEVHLETVAGAYQSSPFTHHLTAATLLALCEALYQAHPEAVLLSVRGYAFGFSRELSPRTAELAEAAGEIILDWLG
jgi:hydrogenase maturation protease